MANDLTHNPLRLDTTGTISATNIFFIKKAVLTGVTSDGTAVLKDGAGKIIGTMQAPSKSVDELNFTPNAFRAKGLRLDSISGTGAVVEIYCA